jgi:hypothetical protein
MAARRRPVPQRVLGNRDVDDIVVEPPERERAARKEEVLRAIGRCYKPPLTNILKYDGSPAG